MRELEDLLFSPIALDSPGKCQGAAEESPGRQRGGRSCRAAGADSAVPGGGSPRDCRASLALSFRGITTGGSSFLPPLFWHETACRRHPRTMIAEFAHFYLFGFICVTSGNHLSRAGQLRGRGGGSAPAAALLPPPSLPHFGPSASPGPLLCSETKLGFHPAGTRPAFTPGAAAGRGGCAAPGAALVPGLPPPAAPEGSLM